MKISLVEEDFVSAAEQLGCQVAAIKAVCQVEAPRGGFNPDDSPVTLFEGHKFFKYTNGAYASTHPTLCFPKWDRRFYGRNWMEEQARLKTAMELDHKAACLSASWGKFQIMGFNYAAAGFASLNEFVAAMRTSEAAQLGAFVDLIQAWELADELRTGDWAGFARVYNGAGYAVNKYDVKLAAAFHNFSTA